MSKSIKVKFINPTMFIFEDTEGLLHEIGSEKVIEDCKGIVTMDKLYELFYTSDNQLAFYRILCVE